MLGQGSGGVALPWGWCQEHTHGSRWCLLWVVNCVVVVDRVVCEGGGSLIGLLDKLIA